MARSRESGHEIKNTLRKEERPFAPLLKIASESAVKSLPKISLSVKNRETTYEWIRIVSEDI
jgi:hypothetical protein